MPFALVIIGLLMVITGVRNTHAQFGAQVVKDFSNSSTCTPLKGKSQGCGFLWWIAAISAVGMIGYAKSLQGLSRAFLALIIVAMVLANRGFFAQLQQSLIAKPASPVAAKDATLDSTASMVPDAAKASANLIPALL